jgi:hypothetical protein
VDSFNLNWPNTTATLFTNGWRCRIVWRSTGGMGGTIDNNGVCKRRLAENLTHSESLLAELRTAGHEELAVEIEGMAPAAEES